MRNLILRFHNLDSSIKREIVKALELVDDKEIRQPEASRYDLAFKRAGARGLGRALELLVEKAEARR